MVARGHLYGWDNTKGATLMRKLLIAIMIAAPLMASACNTIAGVGRDVGAVGGAVTKTAEEAK